MEKRSPFPVIRRIITAILLAGIALTFLAVYYFIYLPQQRASFNARTFRALSLMATSFQDRIKNYGIVKQYTDISKNFADGSISADKFKDIYDIKIKDDTIKIDRTKDTVFNNYFQRSFGRSMQQADSFYAVVQLKRDSIQYNIYKKQAVKEKMQVDSNTQTLAEILNPITTVYAGTFQSVFLAKKLNEDTGTTGSHYDDILYRSENSDINIANINTDSLFTYQSFQATAIRDIIIEDIPYKIFLQPFKMPSYNETFVFAGLMQQDVYNQQLQDIPMLFLLSIIMIITALLLALPFVKVFILSAEESLHLTDIRSLIAVIFIFPFLATLLSAAIWINQYQNERIRSTLGNLQENIQTNFYKEIQQNIEQQKRYDVLIADPSTFLNCLNNNSLIEKLEKLKVSTKDTPDIKDIIFHPQVYKMFTSLHWMNANGNDIASWNMTRKPATYFKLADRDYFRDIKYNRLNVLPHSIDSFSIQPVLSRFTGEYTINIATRSSAKVNDSTAIAMGLSAKMYSVYNTLLPPGYGFCIIDSSGLVLCHADADRNLQENIFKETKNNYNLRTAVKHKDSTLIKDVSLYENPVQMIVKPLPGLSYYLITYHEQRNSYLFTFHVIAFALLCEAMLLLFIALFSYFATLGNKGIGKLLFEPEKLNWLKPSADKKIYYIKNIFQLLTSFIIIYLISIAYRNNGYYFYTLNANFLLPLFCVTGYYLVKNVRTFINQEKSKPGEGFIKNHLRFLWFSRNILGLYTLSVAIFFILQNKYFGESISECHQNVTTGIIALVVIVPIVASFIALSHIDVSRLPGYLKCFIISLITGIILISVIPVLTTVSYAFHEEKKLQLQSMQANMAISIQQRRLAINPITWQTKLKLKKNTDSCFIDSLKFTKAKGIYLMPDDSISIKKIYANLNHSSLNTSLFYKTITRLLFLPEDHDDIFDNELHADYYSWKGSFNRNNSRDTLQLYYQNTTDRRSRSDIWLTSEARHVSLFGDIISFPGCLLLLPLICAAIFIVFKLIYSVSTRVFLIHFFNGSNQKNNADKDWVKRCYQHADLARAKLLLGLNAQKDFSLQEVRNRENELLKQDNNFEEFVLQIHLALEDVFTTIWERCSPAEKFCLYDFAEDGFSNYKKALILYELHNKGLIIREANMPITLVCMSFRNFLITKENSDEIKEFRKLNTHNTWGSFRTVFYIALIAFAVFIFITQQQATQRLITVLTSLGALLPMMLKLFDTSSTAKTANKQG